MHIKKKNPTKTPLHSNVQKKAKEKSEKANITES